MEKASFGGWPNCIRLANRDIELIATTDVGPRIVRLGFIGGQNFLNERRDEQGLTGGDEFRLYGGHRLWSAPEADRTYYPDNHAVEHAWDGKTLTLTAPIEASTGLQKIIQLTLDPDKNRIAVGHRLLNHNVWDVETAPWALTVMAQGGRAILPQEDFRAHADYLLPARPLVLWHYTNMADPRWSWGEKYIQLRQDASASATPQKIGCRNTKGWAAYVLGEELFIKRYPWVAGATYTDDGCNTELFTNSAILEIETLGPMATIPAGGGSVQHIETWMLSRTAVSETEDDIEAKVLPLAAEL